MRGHGECDLLQRRDIRQIECPAVQLLDIVAGNREPERHGLLAVAGVDGHKSISRTIITGEHQHAATLVAIPVVEEEIEAAPDMSTLSADAQQLAHQRYDWLPGAIIEVVPAERPQ